MKCPYCFGSTMRVINTYHDTVESTIRQRKCVHCSKQWFTCEVDIPRTAMRWQGTTMHRLPDFQVVKFTATKR